MTNPTTNPTPKTLAAPQGDDTPESLAGLTVTVIPYTDEDDSPDPSHAGLVMVAIGRPGDIQEHVLDRIPADAAEIIRQHSEAQAAEIARLTAGQDAGREIMRQAWGCLNSFRAQHGSPYCLSADPFDAFMQSLADMLGDDCKPWMTDAAAHLIGPYAITIGQEKDATIAAEERAAKAEADVDLLDRVIGDIAEELGVEQDNEAIHAAIQAIKDERDAALAQVAAMREALTQARCRISEIATHIRDFFAIGKHGTTADINHTDAHILALIDAALSTEAAPPAAEMTARSQLGALRNALLNPPPYACAAVTREFADETKRHELAGAWIMGHRAFAEAVLTALGASAQTQGEVASNPIVIPRDPTAQGGEGGDHAE